MDKLEGGRLGDVFHFKLTGPVEALGPLMQIKRLYMKSFCHWGWGGGI